MSTPPSLISAPDWITICCGLTLRQPLDRWAGPIAQGWGQAAPKLRVVTIPMLDYEPSAAAQEHEGESILIGLIPETEPTREAMKIIEHARHTNRPALLLCERVTQRLAAIRDEGLLVESWDTPMEGIISMARTLVGRQPTVTRLSRELDLAEQMINQTPAPGGATDELQLIGLLPEDLARKPLPKVHGLELGHCHRSAGVIPRDFIDITLIDENTVRIFAADGLNEGTTGALLTVRMARSLKALGQTGSADAIFHPGRALSVLNQELCDFQAMGVPYRAAAMYAVLELHTGELSVACAGYPLPMIAADATARRIGVAATALGTREGTDFPEEHTVLHDGEIFAVCSDGADEALREAEHTDLIQEIRKLCDPEQPLPQACTQLESIYDSLPGSLHRTNDCTVLALRTLADNSFKQSAA